MGAQDPPTGDMVGMQATTDSRPIHRVYVDGFFMDKTDVTNAQFAEFVKATGYITVAEKTPSAEDYPGAPPENLYAGSVVFTPPDHPVQLNDHFQWWRYVKGANWRHPTGPNSSIKGKGNYPVVQVSYQDAQAYCNWARKRLPTEQSGNLRHGVGWPVSPMSGGKSSIPMENGWQIPFRDIFRIRMREVMDMWVWRPWPNLRRTVTDSMTWRAMYGSGLLIGIASTIIPCSRIRVEWRATRKGQTVRSIRPNPVKRKKCTAVVRSCARTSIVRGTW